MGIERREFLQAAGMGVGRVGSERLAAGVCECDVGGSTARSALRAALDAGGAEPNRYVRHEAGSCQWRRVQRSRNQRAGTAHQRAICLDSRNRRNTLQLCAA